VRIVQKEICNGCDGIRLWKMIKACFMTCDC
jgi:hypothetical protein